MYVSLKISRFYLLSQVKENGSELRFSVIRPFLYEVKFFKSSGNICEINETDRSLNLRVRCFDYF